VFDGVTAFDWDLHSVGYVARHGVLPEEVEEAVERACVIIPRERKIYAPEIDKAL